MNLETAKKKALQIMREYSVNGTIVSNARNADYLLSMNALADTAQKEIANFKRINAVHEITQNPITNILGVKGYEMIHHYDTDIIFAHTGSKAYYFEVDNLADVYIEEETALDVWTTLVTINNTNKGSFTSYKGLITASNVDNDIRLRFSGSYLYNIRNRALYGFTFPSDADVPDYRPYLKYTMPTDFADLKQVVREGDPRQYVSQTDFYWESKRIFVVRYSYKGSFQIQYYKYPETITAETADDHEFEIDTEAQELIPYYIGGHVLMDEEEMIAMTLINMYQTKLANLSSSDNIHIPQTRNAMGW